MALEIILGGAALLLLLGGKKKSSSTTSGTGAGPDVGGNGTGTGTGTRTGTGRRGTGTGTGAGPGAAALPAGWPIDRVWVSPDCQMVVYPDGTGEAFWDRYGMAVAQEYINANYRDPYEIALAVANPMIRHCAAAMPHFPIAEDDYDPMEEELLREFFNREYRDVYYLIQFLHDKSIELMGEADKLIIINDSCDVEYIGENWYRLVADKMIRFYLEYSHPVASAKGHEDRYPPWPLANTKHDWMDWQGGIVTAVINRLSPTCGLELINAFKKEPHSAASFFASRGDLRLLYDGLHSQVDWVDDNREGGLDFNLVDELTESRRA